MGPTNIALVNLFQAEKELREAQSRLDHASVSVRQQERRINDLMERLKLATTKLREAQSQAGQLELDIKTRDAHIERLRTQQQQSKNHKEYQTFLTEISTEKIDKTKVEDQLLAQMETVEKLSTEAKELQALLDAEQAKHAQTKAELSGRLSELQAEIDRLRPTRDECASRIPAKALEMFERLSERFEGEAMGAIARPNPRREEYVCTACNMDLVADVYNKLHSRDDLVVCPNCRRLLYIPEDMTPDNAINRPKERKERRTAAPAATVGRQESAIDVMRSITVDEEESPTAQPTEPQAAESQPAIPQPPQPPTGQ